jgi:hypothetical protein
MAMANSNYELPVFGSVLVVIYGTQAITEKWIMIKCNDFNKTARLRFHLLLYGKN